MVFFNVFLKTLGFLLGLATFLIFINLLIYFFSNYEDKFKFIKGERSSNNIIASLELNGPIFTNINQSLLGNVIEYINPENVKSYLHSLQNINPKILIIKINSPGGTVSATASLEKIINDFKKDNKTEVYFFSNEILASGGYWVATTGDKIFANYGTIIGSIGVTGPSWYYYDYPTSISRGIFGQKIETKNGIKIFNQNAGNSKDLYNPFRKPTIKELEHLQSIVKKIYNDFIIKVSNSRSIELSVLENEIGALIFNSGQAKENFLIDDVLDYNDLINNIIKEKNFKDYKIMELNISSNIFNNYLLNYIYKNYNFICNKLNNNFVSVMPLFLNECN